MTLRSKACLGGFWLTTVGAPCALGALGALGALALWVTPPLAAPSRWAAALWGGGEPELLLSLWHARLPRVALAAIVGAGLAVGGLLMQTLTRNPLATPSVLGVTQGAALGLVLALATIPRLGELGAILASFAGAALGGLAIAKIGLSRRSALRGDTLVVAGSILGAFAGSVVTAVVFLHSLQNELLGWTLGRMVHVDWTQVQFSGPFVLAGLLIAGWSALPMESLRLGEAAAKELGVRVGWVQTWVVLAVILLSGASVAAAGPIAYVGLIVPHLLRNHRMQPRMRVLACACGGACLTITADGFARWTSGERLVPLGIWTAFMGSTLFFALSMQGPRRSAA